MTKEKELTIQMWGEIREKIANGGRSDVGENIIRFKKGFCPNTQSWMVLAGFANIYHVVANAL